MKAISLWQPWASLWCSPAKVHETRHWRIAVPTARKLWLAVHAAKRFERDVDWDLARVLERTFGPRWAGELPTGAIVGAVQIAGCFRTEDIRRCYEANSALRPEHGSSAADDLACGNFTPGRFGWKRGQFRVLPEPVTWRGQQGLFEVPDELLAPIFEGAAA